MYKKTITTVVVVLCIVLVSEIGLFLNYKLKTSTELANLEQEKSANSQDIALKPEDAIPSCVAPVLGNGMEMDFMKKVAESLIVMKTKKIVTNVYSTSIWEGRVDQFIVDGQMRPDLPKGTFLVIENPETGDKDYPIANNKGINMDIRIQLPGDSEYKQTNTAELQQYLVKGTDVRIEQIIEPFLDSAWRYNIQIL